MYLSNVSVRVGETCTLSLVKPMKMYVLSQLHIPKYESFEHDCICMQLHTFTPFIDIGKEYHMHNGPHQLVELRKLIIGH